MQNNSSDLDWPPSALNPSEVSYTVEQALPGRCRLTIDTVDGIISSSTIQEIDAILQRRKPIIDAPVEAADPNRSRPGNEVAPAQTMETSFSSLDQDVSGATLEGSLAVSSDKPSLSQTDGTTSQTSASSPRGKDVHDGHPTADKVSAYERAACEAVSIDVTDMEAKDNAWRTLFSRWGGMQQSPCSVVLNKLLEALEPTLSKNFPFTSKNGPGRNPPWWPDIIPWESPSRLGVSGKRAAIAYIAMLPVWQPEFVQQKVENAGVKDFSDIIQKPLEGVKLKTNYWRSTGGERGGAERETDCKKDNTNNDEFRDRGKMVNELIKVAKFMDAVRINTIDFDSDLPLTEVPQTVRRAMYGSGNGKGKRVDDTKRWGKGPSMWGQDNQDISKPRKREREQDMAMEADAKVKAVKLDTVASPSALSTNRNTLAFAIKAEPEEKGCAKPLSFESDRSITDEDCEFVTEPDDDDYQEVPGFTGDVASKPQDTEAYLSRSTMADEGSISYSFSATDAYNAPVNDPYTFMEAMPPSDWSALPRTAFEFHLAHDTNRWGGEHVPEALPTATPALSAPLASTISTDCHLASASAHPQGIEPSVVSMEDPNLSNPWYIQTEPDPPHMCHDRNQWPPGRWSYSQDEIVTQSRICYCANPNCPGRCYLGR